MIRRTVIGLVVFAFATVVSTTAEAAAVTFTGTNGSNLTASVTFDVVGGNLQVTLSNTSAVDVDDPPDILTAVFFNTTGLTLTPVSAVLAAGSTVFFDSAPAGGVVGGEWEYSTGIAGPGGFTGGIKSAGFGLAATSLFPGPDLDPPAAVNGLNYGITSAGDNLATGNAPVTGGVPLIQSSVVFTLSGIPAGFNPATFFTGVVFQYGTALTEPSFGGGGAGQVIPEPATLALFGLAALGIAHRTRRARRG